MTGRLGKDDSERLGRREYNKWIEKEESEGKRHCWRLGVTGDRERDRLEGENERIE